MRLAFGRTLSCWILNADEWGLTHTFLRPDNCHKSNVVTQAEWQQCLIHAHCTCTLSYTNHCRRVAKNEYVIFCEQQFTCRAHTEWMFVVLHLVFVVVSNKYRDIYDFGKYTPAVFVHCEETGIYIYLLVYFPAISLLLDVLLKTNQSNICRCYTPDTVMCETLPHAKQNRKKTLNRTRG